jgi:hypothetical protein
MIYQCKKVVLTTLDTSYYNTNILINSCYKLLDMVASKVWR